MKKDRLFSNKTLNDLENGKLIKRIFNVFEYYFPKLVNRKQCLTYQEECIYCKSKTYRFYSSQYGKKYYQCENCYGIN